MSSQATTVRQLSRRAGRIPKRESLRAAGWGTLATLASIGLLATSGWLITRASERPPVFELSIAIGAVQAFALGRGLCRYYERLAAHGLALDKVAQLRLWLYQVIEPLVPNGLRRRGRGSALNGLVGEVEIVALALVTRTTAAIDTGAALAIGSVLAWLLAPAAGAILVAATVLMVVLTMGFARLARRAAEDAVETRARLADHIVDTVRSAQELVVYGRQELVLEQLDDVRRRSMSAGMRRALAVGLARGSVTLAAGAGLMGVVMAGLVAHAAGRLDGVMLAVLGFVGMAVLDQVAALPAGLAGIAAGDAAAQGLADLEELIPPAPEPPFDRSPKAAAVTATWDEVTVQRPGGQAPILDAISLSAEPGMRIAIVGPNGSGKTSLLHTLLHFIEPSSGLVTLDGVDVRKMTRSGLARHIGWLPEETHVFAATLRDNVRLARPSASDAACEAALRRVGLGSWYGSLPDGLETRIGSGGRPLSAGERQRLGMARLVLSEARVLLLDEPTAHLDPASSPLALAAVLGRSGRRAVVLVGHEPNGAGEVDRMIELEAGRVARTA